MKNPMLTTYGTVTENGIETPRRKLGTFLAARCNFDRVWYAVNADGTATVCISRNTWTTWAGTVSAEVFGMLREMIAPNVFAAFSTFEPPLPPIVAR